MKTAGFVRQVVARDGDRLKKGDVILIGEDPKIDAEVAARTAEKTGYEIQIRQAEAVDQGQMKALLPELTAVKRQLRDALDRKNDLTVRAPIDGTLVAPKLRDLPGEYLQRGQEIGTVAAISSLVVRTELNQEDAQLVEDKTDNLLAAKPGADSPIQVLFVSDLLAKNPTPATAETFVASAQDTVPHPSLFQAGGGDIAPDPTDPHGERPLVRQFEVRVRVDNPDDHYNPGQRAYVRFKLEKRPLIWTWARRLMQLLQSHENDSKLT